MHGLGRHDEALTLTLTHTPTPNPNPKPNPTPTPNPNPNPNQALKDMQQIEPTFAHDTRVRGAVQRASFEVRAIVSIAIVSIVRVQRASFELRKLTLGQLTLP